MLPSSANVFGKPTSTQPAAYYRHVEKTPEELNYEVEYDTDEQVLSYSF